MNPSQWPKLSETLPHKGNPHLCQQCESTKNLVTWIEHDAQDKPTSIMVRLCSECSRNLIVPHPRLYAELPANAPVPGAMLLCIECVHRDGLRCRMAKVNGGPGIEVMASKPFIVHVDGQNPSTGKRFSRWIRDYSSPPSACSKQNDAHQPTRRNDA